MTNVNETINICDISVTDRKETKIKHLVCSGGATFGLTAYGVFKESHKQQLWKIKDIQTMYGCSVGAIMIMMIAVSLQNDENANTDCWDVLDKYAIDRPWQDVFDLSVVNILNSFYNCGILSFSVYKDMFQSVFRANDIPLSVTWKELYEKIPIEIHIFTVQLNTLDCIDISYKTHPDWNVLESLYMSGSVPILFAPLKKENQIYMDAVLMNEYPLENCIQNGADIREILGVRKIEEYMINPSLKKNPETLFDYISEIISQLLLKTSYKTITEIPYECKIVFENLTVQNLYETTTSKEKRKELIENGVEYYKSFVPNINLL